MSWNYSGDPSDSDLDAVRFMIGDTDTSDQQLSDAEVNFLLASYSVTVSARIALRRIIAKYVRYVDKSVGDLKISYSKRIDQYNGLLDQIDSEAVQEGILEPYAGGISISDKDAVEDNSDRVAPAFTRPMHSNTDDTDSTEGWEDL